jgi:hypothetical protein
MTSTDLSNKALGNISMSKIDSIDTVGDAISIACKDNYDDTRLEYLRQADPSFARREIALALASGEESVKWQYVYAYPANTLVLREIWNGAGNNSPKVEYVIGSHGSLTSSVILTNQATPTMFVTVDIENLNVWPASDILAFSYLLASKLASSDIKKDMQLSDLMMNRYLAAMAMSKATSRQEQFKELPDYETYINARN